MLVGAPTPYAYAALRSFAYPQPDAFSEAPMMENQRASSRVGSRAGDGSPQQGPFSPPAISLPKGSGAIRGIGEKLAANPVTGTDSMTAPIATSPARSGFGPQLSLSYDSGEVTARLVLAGACRYPPSQARLTEACRATMTPTSRMSLSSPVRKIGCQCSHRMTRASGCTTHRITRGHNQASGKENGFTRTDCHHSNPDTVRGYPTAQGSRN